MFTIARMFPRGFRRKARAQQKMVEAYKNVFTGVGTPAEAEVVLVDLARVSRYYYVAASSTSAGELQDMNGSRRVYGRILQFLQLPQEALDGLTAAVMLEDAASKEEGTDI